MAIESKTVVKSMFWNLLERFSTQIVSFVISVILARILMPSDYGIIAIIMVFIALANVIIDGGLNTALVQKKNADQVDFSTIFWFCLFISIIIYAVLYISAPLISKFYANDILTPVLRVLGLCVILQSFNSVQRAYVSRNMLFQKMFYVNAIALVISGTIGIIMAYRGYGVWALVSQSLASPFICCVVMWFTVQWRPIIVFSRERFKGLFNFGWKILLTNFIIALYGNIRSLFIGKVYQPAVLAYFDRGKSLPSLVMDNVINAIGTVLLPTFSEEQDNKERVKQMMRRSVQVTYMVTAPLLVGFFFTAKEIVLVLLTAKWLPAVPFIRIFCIAFFLMPIQRVNVTAIQSLGYSGITLKLEILKKIIEAIILVISFMIDVYAVAWGIVVYNAICIFINLHPCKKLVNYGVKEQLMDVLPSLIAALLMGGLVYACELLPFSSILVLMIQFIVGIFSYCILCKIARLESYAYVADYVKQGMKKIINK